MYINEQDQQKMEELINKYIYYYDNNELEKAEPVVTLLFQKYIDQIISGIIFSPQYNYWQYAELEDLIQEGRLAVLIALQKKQWDKKRGNIFNFFSTVVSRNLRNYTTKLNKNHKKKSNLEIEKIFNNPDFTYYDNFYRKFIIDDLFEIIKKHFNGKEKFLHLTELLKHYYTEHGSKKIIKKRFIERAKAYGYSPTFVNTFFSHLKKFQFKDKEIQDITFFNLEEREQ